MYRIFTTGFKADGPQSRVPAMAFQRRRRIGAIGASGGLATAALLASITLQAACGSAEAPQPPALEIYGSVPAFTLVDDRQLAFTNQSLGGHVVIANFIFTRCPTVCPVFSHKMRRIQDQTTDLTSLLLVSFSVDPAHDKPPILAEYGRKHGANPNRWRFVTGDPAVIKRTIEDGLKIAMERGEPLADGVPDIVHGTHFVLLDKRGDIRGYYQSSDADRIDALIRDARRLDAE